MSQEKKTQEYEKYVGCPERMFTHTNAGKMGNEIIYEKPEVTFFKKKYSRHTNFSNESIENYFDTDMNFGSSSSCTMSRNADLLTNIVLEVEVEDIIISYKGISDENNKKIDSDWSFSWDKEFGHFLIKSIEFEIGGQVVDKHYGTWLSIWSSLTVPPGKRKGYDYMIGGCLGSAKTTNPEPGEVENVVVHGGTVYIPLKFWFCRDTGLPVRLISLAYHEVKIRAEFAHSHELYSLKHTSGGSPKIMTSPSINTKIFGDYVYLDNQERMAVARQSHENYISQIQFPGDIPLTKKVNKINLKFGYTCKELVWVVQDDNRKLGNFTDSDSGDGNNPVESAILYIDGIERFEERPGSYFNKVQPSQHHTNIPREGINVYSFALEPENEAPSGSLNMNNLFDVVLKITLTDAALNGSNPVLKLFNLSQNCIGTSSGMSGLKYIYRTNGREN